MNRALAVGIRPTARIGIRNLSWNGKTSKKEGLGTSTQRVGKQ